MLKLKHTDTQKRNIQKKSEEKSTMKKRSRLVVSDDDDDESNSSSSGEEYDNSGSSSSSSSSDSERRSSQRKKASQSRGKGSLSQMKASADREKARVEKTRSSGEPPKKKGRSNGNGSGDDDDEYIEKGSKSNKDAITKDEHDRLVSMAMQLFLFSNTHKRPIRREDINEYVLKDYKGRKELRRLSKSVFDEAVEKMKDVFGYEVKQLKKPIVKGDITTTPSTTASYILLNRLTKPQSDNNDNDNNDDDDDDDDENDRGKKKDSKKVKKISETLVPLRLKSDIEAAHHGLLMLILGIIVLSNGIIQEDILFEKLQMAKIGNGEDNDPAFKSVKDVVSSFVSQHYLTRVKTRGAKKTDDPIKNIVVGPRTFAEFDLREIVLFVMKMFGYKDLNEKHIEAILSAQSTQPSN